MGISQMNIRIDAATKTAGDQVFSSIGYTPTEVARAVWGFAAAHADDSQVVKQWLDEMHSLDLEAEARRERRRLAHEGIASLDQQLQSLVGSAMLLSIPDTDDEGLLEEALVSRLEERELW